MDTIERAIYKKRKSYYYERRYNSENTSISYIRFSSLGQAKEDSYRRQLERTKKHCKEKKLILSET